MTLTNRSRALKLLESSAPAETVLLWQVACELGAVLTRIGPRARNVPDRRAALQSIQARMSLALPTPEVLDTAWKLRDKHQLSYWDALLLAACVDCGVTRLYSEDIQGKPEIEGVGIINPFAPS